MYKHNAVRQIFDKLAHSSIMRLNSTSMSKLFDLMLMSLKLQILKTKFPEEIIQITMNHFKELITNLEENLTENQKFINIVKENMNYFTSVKYNNNY